MTEGQPRLGIDFGRVIQGATLASGDTDTVFLAGGYAEAMNTPPTPGAFETLARLIPRFEAGAWIISKCGPRIQERTLQWLDHHDAYDRLGIPRTHVRFCRARAGKAQHCSELGITHMIDDRLDVHAALRELVPHLYLFGTQTEPVPDWVTHTPDWAAVESAIAASGFQRAH